MLTRRAFGRALGAVFAFAAVSTKAKGETNQTMGQELKELSAMMKADEVMYGTQVGGGKVEIFAGGVTWADECGSSVLVRRHSDDQIIAVLDANSGLVIKT